MSEYTPNTEAVREQYTREQPPQIGTVSQKGREFDRWYAAEIAAAEKRGAVRALSEAKDSARSALGDQVSGHTSTYSVRQWLQDRIDQIEEGE